MRNPYLRTLIPLALICSGADAAPVLNDGNLTPVVTPRDTPILTPRELPIGHCPGQSGPGVMLTNKANKAQTFTFWKNTRNGNGWADPEWNNPDPAVPAVTIPAGETKYVAIQAEWKGRIQRGKLGKEPATWAEFQLRDTTSPAPDFKAHGDISLIQGCDGAVMVYATDGSGAKNGFTTDCMANAPPGAIVSRPDGSKTVGRIVNMWPGAEKTDAAVGWLKHVVPNPELAYQLDGAGNAAAFGVPDVASKDNCLKFEFY